MTRYTSTVIEIVTEFPMSISWLTPSETTRDSSLKEVSKSDPVTGPVWPMTAALEGGEWSAARPGRTLPPGKTRYPFYRRLGGPQGRSERAENLVPTGIRSRTVQSAVIRYTDWATGHTKWGIIYLKYCLFEID